MIVDARARFRFRRVIVEARRKWRGHAATDKVLSTRPDVGRVFKFSNKRGL